MTKRIKVKKWTLYRHTRNIDLLCDVGSFLRKYNSAIDKESKKDLILKLKEKDLYHERNAKLTFDAINHKINQLANYMFGYKVDGKLLFSPLGNLFFKNIDNDLKRKKIFLAMMWSFQYPHPHAGTDHSFKLFPFRLLFKLLLDERLENKLYAHEFAMKVVFVERVTDDLYESLVKSILNLRQKNDVELVELLKKDEHLYVNAIYEWDYYMSRVFESVGILDIEDGGLICKLQHGKSTTRRAARNQVSINADVYILTKKLLENYPADEKVLDLDDSQRLQIDVVKEIYSYYPKELLAEVDELNEDLEEILNLPKLIEQYSNNNEGKEAYLFEEVLTDGFNFFIDVEAKLIGGAGNTDIECLYLESQTKFSVDAKSTKNKLSGLNAGRLESHMDKIGGKYVIVVTPRYVPAVKMDILGRRIVIILASTFSEYLYNHIVADSRDMSFSEIDKLIMQNQGTDISELVSNITTDRFAIKATE